MVSTRSEANSVSHNENKEVAGKIRPACSAAGPNLGEYTQRVRWRAPAEDGLRTLANPQLFSPAGESLLIAVVVRHAHIMVSLQQEPRRLSADALKFQPACPAACLELGDYTQWLRRRAPTDKAKKRKAREEN
jgi:hypothetical protein